MSRWFMVGAVVWLALVAAVVFLALGRISAAIEDETLMRTRFAGAERVHRHLRRLIAVEDRLGIALTVLVAVCSGLMAFAIADEISRAAFLRLLR